MSVRRHDENTPAFRKGAATTSLKRAVNEGTKPAATLGKTKTFKTVGIDTTNPVRADAPKDGKSGERFLCVILNAKLKCSSSSAHKTPALHRTALASLTESIPQQARGVSRPPMLMKASATQTSSVRKTALSQQPSMIQLTKTAMQKPKSSVKTAINVYTPAGAVMVEQRASEDNEIEYMPPKLKGTLRGG